MRRYYVPKLRAIKEHRCPAESFGTVFAPIKNNPPSTPSTSPATSTRRRGGPTGGSAPGGFQGPGPSQRKPVIFAAGTPQVLLPWDNAATFSATWPITIPPSWPPGRPGSRQPTFPAREAANRVGMDEAEFPL